MAVPWGEPAIGLVVGLLTRLAAFVGALVILLFYFGNWDVAHGPVNSDFMYVLVLLSAATLGAGRILVLDADVEQYEVDGRPLIERYSTPGYVLG